MRATKGGKKGPSNSHRWRWRLRGLYLMGSFMAMCLASAVSRAGTSKLYPPDKEESGALRLAQVTRLATRQEILASGVGLQHLLATGLQESDLKDGSLASGRVYCCHRSTEEGTEMWFYVPPEVSLGVGDIVAIRMGRELTKKDPGTVNVAVEVREKKDATEAKCSWDPPKENLWRRVLYCSWMPAEGWTLKSGSHKTWLKPASDVKTQ